MVVGTTRSVLIKVRVRVPKKGLRPRRFTSWAPTLKLPRPTLLPEKKFEFCGSSATMSPAFDRLSFWISCSPITVTGFGVLNVERTMREPVTTTSCTSPLSPAAGALCAQAEPAPSSAMVMAAALAPPSRSHFEAEIDCCRWSVPMRVPSPVLRFIPARPVERPLPAACRGAMLSFPALLPEQFAIVKLVGA